MKTGLPKPSYHVDPHSNTMQWDHYRLQIIKGKGKGKGKDQIIKTQSTVSLLRPAKHSQEAKTGV